MSISHAPSPRAIGISGMPSAKLWSCICVHGCHSTARSRARQVALSCQGVSGTALMLCYDRCHCRSAQGVVMQHPANLVRPSRGFTLIEILVVVVILGILA